MHVLPSVWPPPSALSAALEQLLCNHASLLRGATATLLRVVANLRLHPDDSAFRTLRCGTKAFQASLEPARGAVACLVALGFEHEQGGDAGGRYTLGDAADPGVLAEAEERLRALPQEYERRAARREEEAARSLDSLRTLSRLNRQSKDARVRPLVERGPTLAPRIGSPDLSGRTRRQLGCSMHSSGAPERRGPPCGALAPLFTPAFARSTTRRKPSARSSSR